MSREYIRLRFDCLHLLYLCPGYLLTWVVEGVHTWPGVTTFTRWQLGAASERAHAGAQSEVTARLHTCTPTWDNKVSYVCKK